MVAGWSSIAGDAEDFALARYNSDGSLDGTFGSGGKVTTAIGNGDDIGESVAIQSDGKIVLGVRVTLALTLNLPWFVTRAMGVWTAPSAPAEK